MKRLILPFCAFLPAGSLLPLSATEPDWYSQPVVTHELQADKTLRSGINYGSDAGTARVIVEPARVASRPAALTLELADGAAMSRCLVEVGAGGTFKSNGGTFSRVAFLCRPGGVIELENCTFMQAYFIGGSGTAAGGSTPKVSLKNCTLHFSQIDSPHACALTAKSCRVISTKIEASGHDGSAEAASLLGCIFSECELSRAEVFMASSKSHFSRCVCTGGYPDDMGAYLEKPVLVQLYWSGGEGQPRSAGKVHFEFVTADPTGGRVGALVDGLANKKMLAQRHRLISILEGKDLSSSTRMVVTTAQSTSETSPGVITVSGVTSGVAFKSRITSVNGLLISQLSSGEEAGQMSKLTLTALPGQSGQATTLKFNQEVGEDMQKALNEVSKFAQLRHNGLPGGHSVELGFADKYIDKDGPSAAVACALLLEGALTGKEWDPLFAVTGDMNADGSVQPIGGVQAKVRGATKGGCKIVGIPAKNEKAIPDIFILEGPAPLVQIGIFSLSKFEEAAALADTKRADALGRALAELENVRNVLSRMNGPQMGGTLRTPQAQARLQYILQAAPNCLSAKYLLLFAQGRGPRSLSIGGSIEAADGSALGLIKSISNDVEKSVNTLKGDEVGTSINKLRNLRPKLDPRVWPYVDNVIAYGEVIRSSILNPVRSGARYVDLVSKARQSAQAAKAAFDKLTGDPQVREELGL